MSPIEQFFGHIIYINLDRRVDRRKHAEAEFAKHGITNYFRFPAIEDTKQPSHACTASHISALMIAQRYNYDRCLILEDDFEFRFQDSQDRFAAMVKDVPQDWDVLYLGGHYGDKPLGRVSKNVIRAGKMLTLTAYGVTRKSAAEIIQQLKPHIGPPDPQMFQYNLSAKCYIFQPRLVVQYQSYSDLTRTESENRTCMEDVSYENMV